MKSGEHEDGVSEGRVARRRARQLGDPARCERVHLVAARDGERLQPHDRGGTRAERSDVRPQAARDVARHADEARRAARVADLVDRGDAHAAEAREPHVDVVADAALELRHERRGRALGRGGRALLAQTTLRALRLY